MGLLPNDKSVVTEVNPRVLVLFGGTKQGKTTITSNLDDNLILDLEGGARFYECLSIDVMEEASTEDKIPWVIVKNVVMELKDYKKTHGKNKYKYITVDTAGVLEEITMPYAVSLYKAEARNKNFKGTDLKAVPNGAGWGYIREAFFNTLTMLQLYCDTLIIVAHTKDKTINKGGQEMEVADIDVSGKMSAMLAGKADAIALVYRKKNETILSFETNQLTVAGARSAHLREKEITICESDADGNLTFHWDKIFK